MYSQKGSLSSAPTTIRRATVYIKGDRIVCTGNAACLDLSTVPVPSLEAHLQRSVSDWCVHSLELVDDGRPLADALTNGLSATIMAVIDGSFKNTFETATWTIGTEERGGLLTGSVVCPGHSDDQSAYRSELTGLYLIMTIINQLCYFYSIEEGHVEIGCDGLSALQTAFEQGTVLSTDIPDFDLVGAILHLRKTSQVTWTHRHIKGHQDNFSEVLDVWAQRNVQMDKKVKQHLTVATTSSRHYSIEGEPWQLWVKGKKLTQGIQPAIYDAVQAEDSANYWSTKTDIDPAGLSLVDWKAIGRSMKQISRARRVFITKHTSGMCGVGKFMQRWKEWNTDACPRCGEH
jgi:hypothetical protein